LYSGKGKPTGLKENVVVWGILGQLRSHTEKVDWKGRIDQDQEGRWKVECSQRTNSPDPPSATCEGREE